MTEIKYCDDSKSISIRRDWVDYLLVSVGIVTVLMLICGASIAAKAKNSYVNANKLATAKLLKDYESYAYDYADKYPYLQAFYADFSKENDPDKRSSQQI